jgi:CRISPR-associated endonuclease/helicase Cas3
LHEDCVGNQDFPELFRRATGREPYHYQLELAVGPRADVLEAPTGSGKTQAIMSSWLYQRALGDAPRRLVYALPMRTLVEQTAHVAVELRRRVGRSRDDLPIHVLMGGIEPSDWRERPEVDQILIGTIDMLLSRALGRGYAESRFAWPVSFGLLNSDCRWVFDEVQLMGPARATSAQLDGLRGKFGTLQSCETLWASATVDREALETIDRPQLERVMTVPAEDRTGPLAKRLHATKLLGRVDLSNESGARLPRSIAEAVDAAHRPGERTLVVLNTVGRAQAVARELQRRAGKARAGVVLVHSRFRPADRSARLAEVLADVDPDGPGRIVVATQVVEAGVDMSSRVLVTETAPFSSIVQRLGRCNRAGEHEEASVLWLDGGAVADDARGGRAAAPYLPADLNAARSALAERIGSSLSPEALEGANVFETREDPATLRRRDLIDLFDTSPDLSGLDIDVAPFIRSDDDRNVSVFFRELPDKQPAALPGEDQPAPTRDELVSVPLSQIAQRDAWLFDPVAEAWIRRRGREVPPGGTVLLASAGGAYDPSWGWDPGIEQPVPPATPSLRVLPEGIGDDPESFDTQPQELAEHLRRAAEAASTLAAALALGARERDALIQAAALHDLGKAHPVFQETILRAMTDDADPNRLWAKSGGRSGFRHRRPHFRHELASGLATRMLDSSLGLPEPDLVAYLVASHHGKVRLSIRPAPDEQRPEDAPEEARFALGVADGDRLPAVQTPLGRTGELELELECMVLGAAHSWSRSAVALRDDLELGPFRLAALEALVRVADWRAGG